LGEFKFGSVFDLADVGLWQLGGAVADFKTHMIGSSVAGVCYGYWGSFHQGITVESSLLAAGLCSVAGMLPDLDSDSGIPLRETGMFASAIVPMLMINRFRDLGMSPEAMALASMLVYLAIRFVVIEIFSRYTVHRGMWHSIPAGLSAGLLAYLLMPSPSEGERLFKSIAVVLGFMVHLAIDEIWSICYRGGRIRLKKSFGSALKIWGDSLTANLVVYGQLALFAYLAWGDQHIVERLRERERWTPPHIATQDVGSWFEQGWPSVW